MNSKILAGIVLLVLGFVLYQLGFTSISGQTILSSVGLVIIPDSIGLNGLFFELTGGVVFLLGLLVAIIGVESAGQIRAFFVSQQLEKRLNENFSSLEKSLEQKITANDSDLYEKIESLERTVRNLKPTATAYAGSSLVAKESGKCKYCNSGVDVDTIFCPSCGKSQI